MIASNSSASQTFHLHLSYIDEHECGQLLIIPSCSDDRLCLRRGKEFVDDVVLSIQPGELNSFLEWVFLEVRSGRICDCLEHNWICPEIRRWSPIAWVHLYHEEMESPPRLVPGLKFCGIVICGAFGIEVWLDGDIARLSICEFLVGSLVDT